MTLRGKTITTLSGTLTTICGRIVRENGSDYNERFKLVEFSDTRIQPRFNVAPTQMDLIVRPRDDGRHLEDSHWGLIPTWAKNPKIGARMFNARAENLMERSSFKGLVAERRCIIPVSGFYEWRRAASGKEPLYIHRADGASMALAGLFTFWKEPVSQEWVVSHTIVTCGPNGLMEPIHNRMPVVLGEEEWDVWLDLSVKDPGEVLPLLRPCPDDWLACHQVSKGVNNSRNDGPELVMPVGEAKQR